MSFFLARSSHRADGAPEASVRDAEEGGADRGEREELRPDDIQGRGSIEDALPQNHEVSSGRCKHHELHELGHALARRQAAGEQLERQNRQQHRFRNEVGDEATLQPRRITPPF